MGTRAIITKSGKPFIATHWDGYYDGLGKKLVNKFTDEEIIEVAKEHNIDFADKKVLITLTEAKIPELMKKHNLSEELVRQGYIRGQIITADDYLPYDIENYDDFAEYQYDLNWGEWRYRELDGTWQHHRPKRWKKLK